jgi:hypothetical protein
MGGDERTKEQFLLDYQDIFEGDDQNGYVAKIQFISDIYTYTNQDAGTLDELTDILEEEDEDRLTELHNSIMAHLFGDGENYQGSFEAESNQGNGDYDWYLYFGNIVLDNDSEGFVYRNITLSSN